MNVNFLKSHKIKIHRPIIWAVSLFLLLTITVFLVYADSVTDSFTDETKIDSKTNITVDTGAGQVKLASLKDNGEECSSADECESGNCYVDVDGDRYAPESGTKTCRADSQLAGTDCYDSNANAHPGQTTYYSSHRGDNSFDYNCDGAETKRQGYCDQVTSCYLDDNACNDICLSDLQRCIRAGGTNEYYTCGELTSSYAYCYGVHLAIVENCYTSSMSIYRVEGYCESTASCTEGRGYKSPELKTKSRTCECR